MAVFTAHCFNACSSVNFDAARQTRLFNTNSGLDLDIKTVSRSIAWLVLEKSGCAKSCLNLDLALFLYYIIENMPIYLCYNAGKHLPCFCLCCSSYFENKFSIWSLLGHIMRQNFVLNAQNSPKSTKNERK